MPHNELCVKSYIVNGSRTTSSRDSTARPVGRSGDARSRQHIGSTDLGLQHERDESQTVAAEYAAHAGSVWR